MMAADWSKIDTALLPPSSRVAFYHGLRVCHHFMFGKQFVILILNHLAGACEFMASLDPSWLILLQVRQSYLKLFDGAVKDNVESYSSRRAFLQCTASCKDCYGIKCSIVPESEDLEICEIESLQ